MICSSLILAMFLPLCRGQGNKNKFAHEKAGFVMVTALLERPTAMSEMSDIVERGKKALIQSYTRLPVAMVRGEGSRLWDADGKQYIDLFAGFGGAILGHAHPALVAAVTRQAGAGGRS